MVYLLPIRLQSHAGLEAPLTAAKFQLYLDLIYAQEQPGRASTAIWDVDQHIQVSGQRNLGGGINGKPPSTQLSRFHFIYGISGTRKRNNKRSWYGILSLFAQNSCFTANGKFFERQTNSFAPKRLFPGYAHCDSSTRKAFVSVVLNQKHL